MDIVALIQLKDQHIEVGIASGVLPCRSTAQNQIDLLNGSAPYGFVKRLRRAKSSKDVILLARGIPENGQMAVDFCTMEFDNEGAPTTRQLPPFRYRCADITQDASILVGDALDLGSDQVVVVASGASSAYVNVYASADGGSMHSLGAEQLHIETPIAPLHSHILTAFVPTTSGLDIIQISRHQDKSSASLIFRTYLRGSKGDNRPYSQAEARSWTDPLASKSPEHFFSIKWMPVRYQKPKGEESGETNGKSNCEANDNAIGGAKHALEHWGLLEIFSWYGVLGARLFGSRSRNAWEYELLGQLPYLGQTSIGAGMGCYGDWGHGFLAWSEENEWVDVNLFKRSDERDTAAGSWAMRWDDMERPDVRGWEVEKRPFQ